MWGVIKNIWHRFDGRMTLMTIAGALLLVAVYPLMHYAPAEWFVEDGAVENVQLFILCLAAIAALCAKYERKMFILVAFVVLFLIIREVNGGRAFFCKLYLEPDQVCRWKNMKYGYLADWIRWGIGLGVIIFAVAAKLWQSIWKYIRKAPVFVWDFIVFSLAMIGAQAAESEYIDNEIMEESMETIMYLMLGWLIWRYGRTEIK